MTTTRLTLRQRVRLYLEAGRSYNDAIILAHRAGREDVPPLGNRTQPQSPVHIVKR